MTKFHYDSTSFPSSRINASKLQSFDRCKRKYEFCSSEKERAPSGDSSNGFSQFSSCQNLSNCYDYVSEFKTLSLLDMDFSDAKSVLSISESGCEGSLALADCDSESSADSGDITASTTILSVDSRSGDDDDDDDAYSDFTYKSCISRQVKKRKHAVGDRMDCQSSDNNQNPVTEGKSKKYPLLVGNNVFRSMAFLSILIVGSLIIMCMAHYSALECIDQEMPLANLRTNLLECVIGHNLSLPIILKTIENISNLKRSSKVNFMWWVGPVGNGKSFTKNIVKKFLGPNTNVINVLSSLLPDGSEEISNDVLKLVKKLDNCKLNIVFIDGLDNENYSGFKFLEMLLNRSNTKILNYKNENLRLIIIGIGTKSSNSVINYYLDHYENFTSKFTRHIEFKRLQEVMKKEMPFRQSDNYEFTVVPFLPLEAYHLKLCTLHHMNYIVSGKYCASEPDAFLESFLQARNLTVKSVQEDVLKLHNLYTVSNSYSQKYLVSIGCKRVYHIVSGYLV